MNGYSYITYQSRFGNTLFKRVGKKVKTIPPKPTDELWMCEECNDLPENGKLLMCDYQLSTNDDTTCDRSVCFECANVIIEPEAEWYCNKH